MVLGNQALFLLTFPNLAKSVYKGLYPALGLGKVCTGTFKLCLGKLCKVQTLGKLSEKKLVYLLKIGLVPTNI